VDDPFPVVVDPYLGMISACPFVVEYDGISRCTTETEDVSGSEWSKHRSIGRIPNKDMSFGKWSRFVVIHAYIMANRGSICETPSQASIKTESKGHRIVSSNLARKRPGIHENIKE
jgi:hypothetical protein